MKKQELNELRTALKDKGDINKIKSLTKDLQEAAYNLATKAAESTNTSSEAKPQEEESVGAKASSSNADDDVIDAEFKPSN